MKKLFAATLAAFILAAPLMAQLPDETNGTVPELDAFHKPIYALWHKAWPAKDIAQLKELLPNVEEAYATLAKAKLPGILRDKQQGWDERLAKLTAAMESYRTASAANDTAGILKATEAVHLYYETLIRLVKPVLKELDAFHQILYSLHHYGMPEYQVKNIALAADSLAAKMVPLNAAVLPKRLEKKSEQFDKARKNLDESVKKFVEAVKGNADKKKLQELEEQLHGRYQMVEKVFD